MNSENIVNPTVINPNPNEQSPGQTKTIIIVIIILLVLIPIAYFFIPKKEKKPETSVKTQTQQKSDLEMSFVASNKTFIVGQSNQIEVLVKKNNNSRLIGGDYFISYDPTYLKIDEVKATTDFPLVLRSEILENTIEFSSALSLQDAAQDIPDPKTDYKIVTLSVTPLQKGTTEISCKNEAVKKCVIVDKDQTANLSLEINKLTIKID